MSDERIKSITASNNGTTPLLDYRGVKIRIKVNGTCLKQHRIIYTHGKMKSIYIVYEISKNFNVRCYPTLEYCLFGAVSLTKIMILTSINFWIYYWI